MSDRKAYRHEWYLKNKNKILERTHKYYKEHKVNEVERSKRYYREHREEVLVKIKAYQAARLSEIRQNSKKYYQEHREELKAKRLDKYRVKNGLKPIHYKKWLEEQKQC